MLDPAARERAIRSLWQQDAAPGQPRYPNLYAILDAARDDRIYPRLRELAATEEILCLYQGPAAEELASVAPYLVCLGSSDLVFDWLWNDGWDQDWGIFLWSVSSMNAMREHFRRLTIVQTEEKQRLLFRFYDPRVLGVFLPTCDTRQLVEMFGTVVGRFMLPSNGGTTLESFHMTAARLVKTSVGLS